MVCKCFKGAAWSRRCPYLSVTFNEATIFNSKPLLTANLNKTSPTVAPLKILIEQSLTLTIIIKQVTKSNIKFPRASTQRSSPLFPAHRPY